MKKKALFCGGLAALLYLVMAAQSAAAQEEKGASPVVIHATGNYHAEIRDLVGFADGFDILAGVDFLIVDVWGGLYAGPRLGWYAETVCTAYMGPTLAMYQKPSLGGQIYCVDSASFRGGDWLALPFGLAFDVLFNPDDLHSDPGERFYLFISAFVGARITFNQLIHLEARLEAGLFPFFDPIPYFVKGGLQVGYHF